ncbi:hypothetical protein N0V82_009346 [Gnomoniopsis sp. IMI 355080]|nr:hypothetical protein N0V82_009346 [Gnomoniopsis sp. IMI 355080]
MFESFPDSTLPPRLPSSDLEAPPALCLPILNVTVDVTVDGTVATTELKQSFHNPSELVIPEAHHTFPLYDGAIVTSFECTIGESRVLRGVVKPKKEARQTFEKAKKQKTEAAALLEELTPEIFETSLGNIPPKTTVEIVLKYIHELKVVKAPQGIGLAVTVPTSIAPRYSESTGSSIMLHQLNKECLEIQLRVVDNGHINISGCYAESAHKVSFEQTTRAPQRTISHAAELVDPQLQAPQEELVWKYTTKMAALKRDFIFVIQMHETYRLNSRAVLSPADDSGLAALMVSLRPSELFSNAIRPTSFAGEIIFVLDRSASMGWTEEGSNELKINAMRDAMRLALSGLQDNCAFNIISFGTEVRGIWNNSRACSSVEDLKRAQHYVLNLQADMDGTNILEALRAAVQSRVQSRASTQIILVTDGEVQDDENEPILEFAWRTRKELADKVRFFTLGIGDRVSHRLMETVAELGDGCCDIVDVVRRPHWQDRLNSMLLSAMGPDSWTCNIELGTRFERRTLLDFNIGAAANLGSDPSLVSYIQAPSPVPPLHPYAYRSIFFLLDMKVHEVPNKVTIRTTTPGAKNKAIDVNVELSKLRTIHHLAAKAALQATEDEIKRGCAETEIARHNAEALGVKYSITSRWTSFVAVSEDKAEAQNHNVDIYKSLLKEMAIKDTLHLESSDDEYDICDSESMDDLLASLQKLPPLPFPNLRRRRGRRRPSQEQGTMILDRTANVWCRRAAPSTSSENEEASDTDSHVGSDAASEVEETELYQPSVDGPIEWKDAAGSQCNGLLNLLEVIRAKLHQHFCAGTTDWMGEELGRFPAFSALPNTQKVVLIDTLMMIVYFGTHLAVEEDYWYLIMDKAEVSVLLALGLDGNPEADMELEPVLARLKLSIEHIHFQRALKDCQVERSKQSEASAEGAAETCPICQENFGIAGAIDGGTDAAASGFVCLSDECYVHGGQRRVWETWGSFWKHQVDHGHLLCLRELC